MILIEIRRCFQLNSNEHITYRYRGFFFQITQTQLTLILSVLRRSIAREAFVLANTVMMKIYKHFTISPRAGICTEARMTAFVSIGIYIPLVFKMLCFVTLTRVEVAHTLYTRCIKYSLFFSFCNESLTYKLPLALRRKHPIRQFFYYLLSGYTAFIDNISSMNILFIAYQH